MNDPVGYSRAIMEAAQGEAKPCPRCPKAGFVHYNERMKTIEENNGAPYRGYWIECSACGQRGPEGHIAEAVTGWNGLAVTPQHDVP